METGIRQHLSGRVAAELQASLQYLHLSSSYGTDMFVFAAPVTIGLSVALGDQVDIRSGKEQREYGRNYRLHRPL